MRLSGSAYPLLLVGLLCTSTARPPVRLRTDGATHPLGIQRQRLRLCWALGAGPTDRGLRQSAYQLQLSNATHLLWDSGSVMSNRTILERCCGDATTAVAFASDTSYSWRVRVTFTSAGDAIATLSPYSVSAHAICQLRVFYN